MEQCTARQRLATVALVVFGTALSWAPFVLSVAICRRVLVTPAAGIAFGYAVGFMMASWAVGVAFTVAARERLARALAMVLIVANVCPPVLLFAGVATTLARWLGPA